MSNLYYELSNRKNKAQEEFDLLKKEKKFGTKEMIEARVKVESFNTALNLLAIYKRQHD